MYDSFCFDQDCTVRNNNWNGDWGEEERGPLPISKDAKFKIELKVEDTKFKIEVNGDDYCEFQHRTPYTFADGLQIQGDVTIDRVKFK